MNPLQRGFVALLVISFTIVVHAADLMTESENDNPVLANVPKIIDLEEEKSAKGRDSGLFQTFGGLAETAKRFGAQNIRKAQEFAQNILDSYDSADPDSNDPDYVDLVKRTVQRSKEFVAEHTKEGSLAHQTIDTMKKTAHEAYNTAAEMSRQHLEDPESLLNTGINLIKTTHETASDLARNILGKEEKDLNVEHHDTDNFPEIVEENALHRSSIQAGDEGET